MLQSLEAALESEMSTTNFLQERATIMKNECMEKLAILSPLIDAIAKSEQSAKSLKNPSSILLALIDARNTIESEQLAVIDVLQQINSIKLSLGE